MIPANFGLAVTAKAIVFVWLVCFYSPVADLFILLVVMLQVKALVVGNAYGGGGILLALVSVEGVVRFVVRMFVYSGSVVNATWAWCTGLFA